MDTLRRLYERATAGPTYDPDRGDLADLHLAGLALPLRASIAVFAATALILVDELHWLLPPTGDATTEVIGLRLVPLVRFALFLVAPLAVILVVFRDRPARYGLRLGDWRWGAALLVAGLAVMTPIILALSGLPSFRSFYGGGAVPLGAALLNNLVELVPAEFLLRGFLMFALWRRIGPLALVIVQVPFILTHVGKPEVELWSTFVGGTIFAWLDWRTRSILWSAIGHVYVLTLMSLAVGGATL